MKPLAIQRLDMRRLSLRTRIVAITGVSGALVVILLVAAFSLQMRGALKEALTQRAAAASQALADHLSASTDARGAEALRLSTSATLLHHADMAYVAVRDARGELLSYAAVSRLVSPALLPGFGNPGPRELYVGGRPVLESSVAIFVPSPGSSSAIQEQVGSVQV
ncbi:MAG: methyl-accepting chemotaxis protein, partial [Cystobacter sp.]